jgi:hypothetical protein
VYLLPGYSKNAQPYDLLVVFDGQTFIDIVPTPTTLDNLISEKRIAPTVALIVGNVNGMRGTELPCNPTFAIESDVPFGGGAWRNPCTQQGSSDLQHQTHAAALRGLHRACALHRNSSNNLCRRCACAAVRRAHEATATAETGDSGSCREEGKETSPPLES